MSPISNKNVEIGLCVPSFKAPPLLLSLFSDIRMHLLQAAASGACNTSLFQETSTTNPKWFSELAKREETQLGTPLYNHCDQAYIVSLYIRLPPTWIPLKV